MKWSVSHAKSCHRIQHLLSLICPQEKSEVSEICIMNETTTLLSQLCYEAPEET